jgi:hypothetical protein
MATQTRNPTSEVAVTGTWRGTSRHLLLDDHPDSGNPAADLTTCSAAGTLVLGFSAFTIPANSTAISVQVLYYDFKNGSQGSVAGSLIRCNDTTNRLSATHNPGNGNAAIALRSDNYATNPKSGQAWTVDDVNRVGTNGLTAFGLSVTDASPTVVVSSAQIQVTYTPPNTPFAAQLSTPPVAVSGGTMTRLNAYAGTLSLGTVAIASQQLTWTLTTLEFIAELTSASLGMTANALSRFNDWTTALSAPAVNVLGRAFAWTQDTILSLSQRPVSITANAIAWTIQTGEITRPLTAILSNMRAVLPNGRLCATKAALNAHVKIPEAVHPTGIPYISDLTTDPVPPDAVFLGGFAYSQDGIAYVTTDAKDAGDVFLGGVAVRPDGAMRATTDEPEVGDVIVGGHAMKQDGTKRIYTV